MTSKIVARDICSPRTARIATVLLAGFGILSSPRAAAEAFRRGDVNGDGIHNITDPIASLSWLFLGTTPPGCEDAADADDDGHLGLTDAIYLLNYLFQGGPEPPAPYPDPGADPTPDTYACLPCGSALPHRPFLLACPGEGDACKMVEESVVEGEAHFRNDAPAIVLDAAGAPHVLFSVAENGYRGFHSHRLEDGSWATEPMRDESGRPIPVATVDAVLGSDLEIAALVNSGDLHTTLWRLGDRDWSRLEELKGLDGGHAHGLTATATGCLYAAVHLLDVPSTRPGIARRRGEEWELTPVENEGAVGTVLALSPDGEVRLAYWYTSRDGEWVLRLAGLSGEPETATHLGSRGLERPSLAFELTAPGNRSRDDPQPHILFSRPVSEGQAMSLQYATREASGEWVTRELAREEPLPDCGLPATDGQTCQYEHTAYRPLRIVSSDRGAVRFLFSRLTTRALLTVNCNGVGPVPRELGPPPPRCRWEGVYQVEGDLRIGWLDGETLRTATLVPGLAAASLDALTDEGGNLHIAAYQASQDTGNTIVGYVRVGGPR